jgi:hypothetical protein
MQYSRHCSAWLSLGSGTSSNRLTWNRTSDQHLSVYLKLLLILAQNIRFLPVSCIDQYGSVEQTAFFVFQ